MNQLIPRGSDVVVAYMSICPFCVLIVVGINNIKTSRLIKVERYRFLLQALLRILPKSSIIACELFKRTDIDDQDVKGSNEALLDLVEKMNENLG